MEIHWWCDGRDGGQGGDRLILAGEQVAKGVTDDVGSCGGEEKGRFLGCECAFDRGQGFNELLRGFVLRKREEPERPCGGVDAGAVDGLCEERGILLEGPSGQVAEESAVVGGPGGSVRVHLAELEGEFHEFGCGSWAMDETVEHGDLHAEVGLLETGRDELVHVFGRELWCREAHGFGAHSGGLGVRGEGESGGVIERVQPFERPDGGCAGAWAGGGVFCELLERGDDGCVFAVDQFAPCERSDACVGSVQLRDQVLGREFGEIDRRGM